MLMSKNALYYGTEESLPERTEVRAGPLKLIYEGGDLRYIKLGNQEILRRIYAAVRDHNWDTIQPALSNVQLDQAGDSFTITYNAEHKHHGIDLFWQASITGDAKGTITYKMNGRTRSTFLRNRIGFCILHPMACAHVPGRIEHVNGAIEECPFPRYIAPQLFREGHPWPVAPFHQMRALSHQVLPNLWAEVRFEGDIFEMEDQRNWTDASFKIYSTPLELPFPVEVKAGTEIFQSVTLILNGEIPETSIETADDKPTFRIEPPTAAPLPNIGLGVASHGQPLTFKEIERLKTLNLSHLRVDLELSQPNFEARLRQAAAEARELSVSLEVALILSDAAANEFNALMAILEKVKPPVLTWLIFHKDEKTTSEKWIKLARKQLRGYDPAVKIGAGTNAFFTELNRTRQPADAMDVVAYSINPQVHAFDNASLVETLAAQKSTVESARRLCGNLPLAVTPITFKMRFIPHIIGPQPEPAPGELPFQVDERQMSLFGAGWTAGSLKYVLESNVFSVTYYETTGWRGVMETETGCPIPAKFHSLPGAVFPLYHVLADVGAFAGGEVIRTVSSHPLQIEGLAMHKDGKTRVIIANLSAEPQQITVQNLSEQVWIRCLDETSAEKAMLAPEVYRRAQDEKQQTSNDGMLTLNLLPYAIARFDNWDKAGAISESKTKIGESR